MKIRQRTIKHINALYPKIAISESPVKKAFTSSYGLIRTIECPTLMPKDIRALVQSVNQPIDQDACVSRQIKQILFKLRTLLQTWVKVIKSNETVRQQYENNPLNMQILQKYDKILKQFQTVQSKSQFINQIGVHGYLIFNDKIEQSLQTNFKQIYVLNSTDNYSTISDITEDQYLSYQQNTIQKIFTMLELIPDQRIQQISHQNLQKLIQKLQNSQYFTKNDNQFNKIIKYNASQAEQLSKVISSFRRNVYSGNLIIRQSIFVCYYLCFLVQGDLEKLKTQKQAKQMLKFICEKQDQIRSVFPKLYERKSKKALVKINLKQNEQMQYYPEAYYQQEMQENSRIRQSAVSYRSEANINSQIRQGEGFEITKQVQQLLRKIGELQYKYQNTPRPLQQKAFTNIYGPLQKFCAAKIVQNDDFQIFEKVKHINDVLSKLESGVLQAFVRPGNKERRVYNKNHQQLTQMRQSSLSQNNQRQNKNRESYTVSQIFDKSLDQGFELQEQVNESALNQYINAYLYKTITTDHAYKMEDTANYQTSYLAYLIRKATILGTNTFDCQYIKYFQSAIKSSISDSKVARIFSPKIKHELFQLYYSKLVHYGYHLTKLLSEIQSQQLEIHRKIPQNLLNFIIARQSYVKFLLKKIQKVLQITAFLNKLQSQLQNKRNFDIAESSTYEFILKLVIISKQLKAFQYSDLQFVGQRGQNSTVIEKVTNFLTVSVYKPILQTINSYFESSSSQSLYELYEKAQKAFDLFYETEKYIEYYNALIAQKKRTFESNRAQMNQVINPILAQFCTVMKNNMKVCDTILGKRSEVFIYSKLDRLKIRIEEYIQVINAIQSGKAIDDRILADSAARNLLKSFF